MHGSCMCSKLFSSHSASACCHSSKRWRYLAPGMEAPYARSVRAPLGWLVYRPGVRRLADNTAPRIGRVGARKKTGRQFEPAIRNFISVPTPRLQQAGYSFPRPSVSGVAETGATENLHPRTGKHAQMENWIMTFVATSSALSETMSEANTHTIDQAGWSMTRENAQQETH